jgi:hypothetical protein
MKPINNKIIVYIAIIVIGIHIGILCHESSLGNIIGKYKIKYNNGK